MQGSPSRVVVLLVAIASAIVLGAGPAPPARVEAQAAPSGLALAWADEFDREGPPDPANWQFERGFVRNEEAQWYQPQNAVCRDGLLVIEARRERVANPSHQAGSAEWRTARPHADYTSASITTRGRHAWQFGRFEMRGRIDARPGLWPAFWTLGVAGEWPDSGEIDVMESYRGLLLANAAWGTATRWTAAWDDSRTPIATLGGDEWARRFHVWRMDWDERAIRLSVDGRELNAIDLSRTRNPRDGRNPFHQPHYILLNLAVGGRNGGDPAGTSFPGRFEVDYVRVYTPTAR